MKDEIYIRDEEELKDKIKKIKEDGISHLHVVADFDRTLTPAFIKGQKMHTGIAQIRENKYLTQDYAPRAHALFDKYHPIEISNEITLSEKKKKMLEWWTTHLKLLTKCGMNKGVINDIVENRLIKYRQGTKEFLDVLAEHRIPLLILSSGVGDLIEGSLKKEGMFHANIHIISNFFDFGYDGKAKGYKSAIIHVFNKNEGQIKSSPYYGQIKNKKNVILLGDSLGDSSMLEGLSHDTIIKIGFLNENVEKSKTTYAKEFDVLILNDGPMEYVNDLLSHIF
jgi:5'-nucleotidase